MLRDPQEFIKCTKCHGEALVWCDLEQRYKTCSLCDGSAEIHPSDDDEEPDGDFKFDEERDRGV